MRGIKAGHKKSDAIGAVGTSVPAAQKSAGGTFNRSRYSRYLSWRMSARHYAQSFGLKFKAADRISLFIYQVIGEEDLRFLSAMETWVREVALVKGSIDEILEAILVLKVCRIDPGSVRSCRSVRGEVIRYVKSRYTD